MKKIEPQGKLVWITYASDQGGVGYIRTIIPSVVLGAKRYKKMSFEPNYLLRFITDSNWYKSQSFVKFQRSATKDQLEMFKYFKNNISRQSNTPMIYDIDDLLFNIPEWNFASSYYKEYEPYVKEMLKLVDGITVSTPYLKQVYSEYNKNISVVRNRLAKCLWGDIKEYSVTDKTKPRIIYPGSQNHFGIPGRTKKGGDIGKEMINFIKSTKKEYD